jgi:hypothetical protein
MSSSIHNYHPWDFYYMHNLSQLEGCNPLLFVPTYQVADFLECVNKLIGDTKVMFRGELRYRGITLLCRVRAL